jgi:excisionase family DNA binding protein
MTEQLLLNTRQAAHALAVSERTVRYLIARGELGPICHIGRAVRIPTSSLEAYVKRLTATTAAAPQMEQDGSRSARQRVG